MIQIGIILGSKKTDLPVVEDSGMLKILNQIKVSYIVSAISAHRNPGPLKDECQRLMSLSVRVFIGIAGMAAALPGAITSNIEARRPVLGVALDSGFLDGLDALFSIVRMPPGMPVGTMGIGKPGLINAAIQACQIIALNDDRVFKGLSEYLKETHKPEEIGIIRSNDLI